MNSQSFSRSNYGEGPVSHLSRRYLQHGVPAWLWL